MEHIRFEGKSNIIKTSTDKHWSSYASLRGVPVRGLFSYQQLVAIKLQGVTLYEKHSVTTGKHMSVFTHCSSSVRAKDNSYIELYANTMDNYFKYFMYEGREAYYNDKLITLIKVAQAVAGETAIEFKPGQFVSLLQATVAKVALINRMKDLIDSSADHEVLVVLRALKYSLNKSKYLRLAGSERRAIKIALGL